MRYKAAYRPSKLLCPLRYEWVPFDVAKPLLDRKRYVVLSDYATFQGVDSFPPNVSEHVMKCSNTMTWAKEIAMMFSCIKMMELMRLNMIALMNQVENLVVLLLLKLKMEISIIL